MKRKICFITGTRADYGILSPILSAVKKSSSLELCLVVTAMHLMKDFGLTAREIKKDGYEAEKINISYQKDSGEQMAVSVGQAVLKFAKLFAKIKPDIIVVLGDRGEMLAGAITANFLNIPVAHIHGGEVSGHVDGILRHAITKLSHLHFAATDSALQRILKLGEEPWRVKVSGAPALDRIINEKLPSKDNIFKKYNLDAKAKTILVVQHPVSTEIGQAAEQIRATLQAAEKMNLQTVIIYPNADAGGRAMIKEVEKYRQNNKFKIFKSIPQKDYFCILKSSSVLVGNSSSGIIEAASFEIPVVDIGTRQSGRERGQNVCHVFYGKDEIYKAIKEAIARSAKLSVVLKKVKNPYGQGMAAAIITDVLTNIPIDKRLLEKKITY